MERLDELMSRVNSGSIWNAVVEFNPSNSQPWRAVGNWPDPPGIGTSVEGIGETAELALDSLAAKILEPRK